MITVLPHKLNQYKTKFWRLKEWTMKLKKGKLKEQTRKIKEWTMKSNLMSKKDITYEILPPSTPMTVDTIGAPWTGST